MSNIEKAKEYAEGKIAEALSLVVADAYIAGYNAGYQDGIDKVAKDSALEEPEYIDLGLPSGTLWASDFVKDGDDVLYVSYPEAAEYNIPTETQVKELEECCMLRKLDETSDSIRKYIVLGPNGNTVTFKACGYMEFNELKEKFDTYFWQVDNSHSPKEIEVPLIYYNNFKSEVVFCDTNTFSGNRIPIRLVKSK